MTDIAVRPSQRPGQAARLPAPAGRPDLEGLAYQVGLALVLGAAVVLRFGATSALWLDEAQSVAIAKLPLTGSGPTLVGALRQDGSPPLYYLLLHGWIGWFGTGGTAVRTLSALLNLVCLPPLYLLARRVVGRPAAWVTVVLFLTSPFALYFSTETRMYSLLVLLTALGGLALERTLRMPSVGSVGAFALCCGLLALTHYWCLYLLMAVGVWLAVASVRGSRQRSARRALAGLALGALVFAPWLPVFVLQLRHTGTPWGEPASFAAVVHAYGEWAGGPTTPGRALLILITALVAFGVAGRPLAARQIVLDLRGHEPGRSLFLLATGTLALAVAVGQLVGNAWADRYTATAFVPFLLVVALGTRALAGRRTFRGVVAVVTVLGLVSGFGEVRVDRTQAREVAHALQRTARPGDVLLVCPDQLGPGLVREVPSWLRVRAVPTYGPADRVDWVDYERRNAGADGAAVADRALAEAGSGHTVFLAASGSYRTYETLCVQVRSRLQERRPGADQLVAPRDKVYEHYELDRFAVR
ncbi:MAG TPA: glycosyltransferase family 39 protein [Frankiaceae bacterium]|nr:glycosyltransferase family 39 protein [Frankiaceae bacterium]